jgi:hypothetical protein
MLGASLTVTGDWNLVIYLASALRVTRKSGHIVSDLESLRHAADLRWVMLIILGP